MAEVEIFWQIVEKLGVPAAAFAVVFWLLHRKVIVLGCVYDMIVKDRDALSVLLAKNATRVEEKLAQYEEAERARYRNETR